MGEKIFMDLIVKSLFMKKISIISVFLVCISLTANAQFSMFGGGNRANQDSLRKIAAADYADMLAKVGVVQPREGRQPNSQDESKHPNYDELTANPYPFYPDPLVTESGKKVTNAKMWYKVRRPEIVRLSMNCWAIKAWAQTSSRVWITV